jgi:hypothetical protein
MKPLGLPTSLGAPTQVHWNLRAFNSIQCAAKNVKVGGDIELVLLQSSRQLQRAAPSEEDP